MQLGNVCCTMRVGEMYMRLQDHGLHRCSELCRSAKNRRSGESNFSDLSPPQQKFGWLKNNNAVEPVSLFAGDKNDNCRDQTQVEWISLAIPQLAE